MSTSNIAARIRLPAGGVTGPQQAPTLVTTGRPGTPGSNVIPCKEWCITDDMMCVSDTLAFTIANVNGDNSGIITKGQRVEFEESDPSVAGGQWTRHFTGVVTRVQYGVDIAGGAQIMVQAMDLGWHLTKGCAQPLTQIKYKRFTQLLSLLLDPSWGFAGIVASNDLNKRLKHGRQVIVQNSQLQIGQILPYIQVEPGQKPFDLIVTYAARDGVLVNVSATGELVFFQPNYNDQPLYTAVLLKQGAGGQSQTNLEKHPTIVDDIEGIFSETQCWSTAVIPPAATGPATDNPNQLYRHETYVASPNPLPFYRREVFSDGEAINKTLRRNRAIWRWQLGQFHSWSYECDFKGHSQNGAFFISDTMITINDQFHQVNGGYYVQSVRRSCTMGEGAMTHLVIRRPGLLNPALAALPDSGRKKTIGGGARGASATPKVVP